MVTPILLVIAAYFWGGIPSAYIFGRHFRGIDIRDYGSGNVGASNIIEHVSFWDGFFLGIFDCVGKGTVVVVVSGLLDQSIAVQSAVGISAVVGHNWSPYIRFTGGRGVATLTGVMLGFFMWREMLLGVLTIGILGKLFMRDTAFMTLVTLVLLPVVELIFGRTEFVYMFMGSAILISLKRLLANWERPPDGYTIRSVIANRILWDRDVPRDASWTSRSPD